MKTAIREIDLCKPVVALFTKRGCDVRQEREITIDGETSPCDLIAMQDDNGQEIYAVIEVKRTLNATVVEQITRYAGFAHWRWVAVAEPKSQSKPHQALRGVLRAKGVGLIYVRPDGSCAIQQPKPLYSNSPDISPVKAAFHAGGKASAKYDAKAGSAGAKRITTARGQYVEIADFIAANEDCRAIDIINAGLWTGSPQALIKLVKRGQVPSSTVNTKAAPARFRAKN